MNVCGKEKKIRRVVLRTPKPCNFRHVNRLSPEITYLGQR